MRRERGSSDEENNQPPQQEQRLEDGTRARRRRRPSGRIRPRPLIPLEEEAINEEEFPPEEEEEEEEEELPPRPRKRRKYRDQSSLGVLRRKEQAAARRRRQEREERERQEEEAQRIEEQNRRTQRRLLEQALRRRERLRQLRERVRQREEAERRRRGQEEQEEQEEQRDDQVNFGDDDQPQEEQQEQQQQQPVRHEERSQPPFRWRVAQWIEYYGLQTAYDRTLEVIGQQHSERVIDWVKCRVTYQGPDPLDRLIRGRLKIPEVVYGERANRGDIPYVICLIAITMVREAMGPYLQQNRRPAVTNIRFMPADEQINKVYEPDTHYAADMFNDIVNRIMVILNQVDEADLWSGIRVTFFDDLLEGMEYKMIIYIHTRPGMALQRGHSFTEELNQEIHELYGANGVLVPRNVDRSCVWYAMGISYLYYIQCKTAAERRRLFTEQEKRNGISMDVLKVSLQPSNRAGDEIVQRAIEMGEREFMDELMHRGENIGEALTMRQAESFFERALAEIIPDAEERNKVCLKVYIIKTNVKGEMMLFPAYIGPNRGREAAERSFVIVNYISERLKKAHYVVPTSMEHRFGAPGKVRTDFWVCQKCGLICFTRSVLIRHVCGNADGSITYGWNDRATTKQVAKHPESDIFAEGYCRGCRLCFDSQSAYQYHCDPALGGCFTSSHSGSTGLRGYRHVLLSEREHLLDKVDCEGDTQYAESENALLRVYADFESVIDPERENEHRLLYWGMWVEQEPGVYTDGRSIRDFLLELMRLIPQNERGRGRRNDQNAKRIIVWFHNGSGYDFNFIFKELMNNEEFSHWRIGGNLRGSNKWQQLKVTLPENRGQIVFKDTYQFLTLSLAKLVSCSRGNEGVFVKYHEQLRQRYGEDRMTAEMCEVVTRKNSLPYTYFTDEDKINEPIEEIMDTLSPEEQRVARALGFDTTGDWLRLYLMSDVLLLRCVFERARRQLRETHHVLFDRYVGLPSTTWHAWIKSLAMLPEDRRPVIPLYNSDSEGLFFKRMVRGGVTCASKRYAVSDPTHTILYLDVNGLYPHVMRRAFPAGELCFTPMTASAQATMMALTHHAFVDRVCTMWKNGHKWSYGGKEYAGGAFEVDMHLPPEHHDRFAQFPLAPEHVEIEESVYEDNEYLSTSQASSPEDGKERKNGFKGLACTLWPKRRYQVHWRVLLWYIRQGMVVDHVHYMTLWTEERPYLRDYVEMNMRLRDQHRDELTRTLYKLMGNALYGKTFENPFNHTGVSVVSNELKLYGLLEQGRVHSIIYQGRNGSLIVNEGERVVLDKPSYIGAIVLEYAKLHMYKLFYEKLNRAFPIQEGKMELLYTDTDSFVVRVEHPPEMRPGGGTDISRILRHINDSQTAAGKREVIGIAGGLTKSETGEDDYIAEFCALRAKSYAYRTAKGKSDVKAKGTTHEAQQRELDIEKYKKVLRENSTLCLENQRIARSHFDLHSVTQVRVALSANDGKRWICANGIDTLPFGHYSLPH